MLLLILTAWAQLYPRSKAGPRERAMQLLMLRMEMLPAWLLVRGERKGVARHLVQVPDRDCKLWWAQVAQPRQAMELRMVQRPQCLPNQEGGPGKQCLLEWHQHEM